MDGQLCGNLHLDSTIIVEDCLGLMHRGIFRKARSVSEKVKIMFYWCMLFISIVGEIIGTGSIKYAGEDAGAEDYLLLFFLVASSYYFLSKAVQGIPMSLAYAVWEGIGLIGMLVLGYWLFDETIHRKKLLACGIIVAGIVMLNYGRVDERQKGERE